MATVPAPNTPTATAAAASLTRAPLIPTSVGWTGSNQVRSGTGKSSSVSACGPDPRAGPRDRGPVAGDPPCRSRACWETIPPVGGHDALRPTSPPPHNSKEHLRDLLDRLPELPPDQPR